MEQNHQGRYRAIHLVIFADHDKYIPLQYTGQMTYKIYQNSSLHAHVYLDGHNSQADIKFNELIASTRNLAPCGQPLLPP